MPAPRESLPPGVLDALQRGQFVRALQLLRGAKGIGPAESKASVGRSLSGSVPAGARTPPADASPQPRPASAQDARPRPLPPSVVAALQAGRRMEAIRLLVMESGMGLAEARRAIDAHEGSAAGLSPGEVPRTGSTLWVWVVLALVGYLVYRLLGG